MVNFVLTFKQNLRRFYASDVIMLATDIYFSMFIVSNLEEKKKKKKKKLKLKAHNISLQSCFLSSSLH